MGVCSRRWGRNPTAHAHMHAGCCSRFQNSCDLNFCVLRRSHLLQTPVLLSSLSWLPCPHQAHVRCVEGSLATMLLWSVSKIHLNDRQFK